MARKMTRNREERLARRGQGHPLTLDQRVWLAMGFYHPPGVIEGTRVLDANRKKALTEKVRLPKRFQPKKIFCPLESWEERKERGKW